jgi:hypothetical protein
MKKGVAYWVARGFLLLIHAGDALFYYVEKVEESLKEVK